MHFTLFLIISVAIGDSFSGKAKIDGIGEIALPPGNWTLEHAVTSEKRTNNPDVYVFKKDGDRLERLTFQKFGPHIAHPIAAYLSSIGDSTSNGIPVRLLDGKNEHDTVHIIRSLFAIQRSGTKVTCMGSSFIYTSEVRDPWMSHAFVCDRDGWVLVCVHASPHAISPETVEQVLAESRSDKGTRDATEEGRTRR